MAPFYGKRAKRNTFAGKLPARLRAVFLFCMKEIRAEVLTIGDEILFGQITDTNTAYLSTELAAIGIRTVRKSSVGDSPQAILQVLAEAAQRADVVLMTGGLGPTKDDLTKHTLCTYFDTTLEQDPEALAMVTAFFKQRGRELTELNRRQADLPVGCTYLPNTAGTAPGMWFERNGTVFVSMPGVPHEMKTLMAEQVLPRLAARFALPVIYHQFIMTVGLGESFLAEKIAGWENALPPHIRLAYLPSMGLVRLRLTATGHSLTDLQHEVNGQVELLKPLLQTHIFSYENEAFEEALARLLRAAGVSISTAESCTGGYLSSQLTKVAGSSAYFLGGVVAYANAAKTTLLEVEEAALATEGAVSEAVARQMAEGIRRLSHSTYGLATTGIAGPGGGSTEKPVGLVYIALAGPQGTAVRQLQLGGTRQQIIHMASLTLLNWLRLTLSSSSTS